MYAAMAYRHPRDTRESSFPFQWYSMGEAENFTRVSLEEEKRGKKDANIDRHAKKIGIHSILGWDLDLGSWGDTGQL